MIYSTSEVAKRLGCHRDTVTRNCRRHGIGVAKPGRRLLTEEDVERLRKILAENKVGNPNFGPGFWDDRPRSA